MRLVVLFLALLLFGCAHGADVAFHADGKTLFSANGPSNDISIVDVESGQVRAKVPVGMRPWGMVFVP